MTLDIVDLNLLGPVGREYKPYVSWEIKRKFTASNVLRLKKKKKKILLDCLDTYLDIKSKHIIWNYVHYMDTVAIIFQ